VAGDPNAMIVFALSGIIIGAVLGTRFTVLALIPAITFSLAIGLTSALMQDGAFGPTLLELALLVGGLQMGYVCSASLGFALRPRGIGSFGPGRRLRNRQGARWN
jgi:hypothetical protein